MRSARWEAIGTQVQLVVMHDEVLEEATRVVAGDLWELDRACSRFRLDSELRRLRAGRQQVGPVLAAAIRAALEAAEQTAGLVDPTLGGELEAAGYDRTFSSLPPDGPPVTARPGAARWREIRCQAGTLDLPAGVQLDLGATAKAWAADRAAQRVAARFSTGVLVELGGDLAVAGPVPDDGWPVDVAGQVVAVRAGGLATSSTQRRTWLRGGRRQHHVLDPRTGAPARTPWATVTVAAATCLEANTASTAAIVLGAGAVPWLTARRLPARLVARDGSVRTTGDWPQEVAA